MELVNEQYNKNTKFQYKIQFAKSFIRDLKNEKKDGVNILNALVARLTVTQSLAVKNKALHDEPVKSSGKGNDMTRRFRVSGCSGRIHYVYEKETLRCIHYYPKSKHNVGL